MKGQSYFQINASEPIVSTSIYIQHLERWDDVFPSDQILVIDGRNLKDKPWRVFDQVQDFLGLERQISKDSFVYEDEKGFYCFKKVAKNAEVYETKCLDNSKGRDHPQISERTLETLGEFFRVYNSKFAERTGIVFWDKAGCDCNPIE